MIKLSICLTDLPKDKITTAKNGKKYINLVMWENKEVDKFGNTHNIQVNKSDKTEQTVYVGNAVDYDKKPKEPAQSETDNSPNSHDDLPF